MKIDIINTSNNPLPSYATDGSAGFDLRAFIAEPLELYPMERVIVPTGIKMALPRGYEGQIRPRSGLSAKKGIVAVQGTIDSDYRGFIGIILINLSKDVFVIEPGDRLAQMVIAKHETAEFNEVDSLDDTERGEGGFGHSGVK